MKLQKILFTLFALLSCVPIILVTVFTGNSLISLNREKLDDAYFHSLNQQSDILSLKFNTIDTCAKSLFTDQSLLQIVAAPDFANIGFSQRNELSNIITRYFHQKNLISDIIIFSSQGGYYSLSGQNISDPVDFMLQTEFKKTIINKITWSSRRSDFFNNGGDYFVASSSIDISAYTPNNAAAFANMFFIVDANFLNDDINHEENEHITTSIYNRQGNLIFSTANKHRQQHTLLNLPTELTSQIYNNHKGIVTAVLNGEKKVFLFLRDNLNDYYLLRTVSYEYYNTENIKIIENLIYMTVLFLSLCAIISWLLSRWLDKPFSKLIYSIKNNTLDAPLYIKASKFYPYEFNYIYEKFNKMVSDMNTLHRERISSELTLSESKLTALKYQINPHFINNTLSSIKIKLLDYGINDVAEMVSVFAALIHSSLNNPPILSLYVEIENIYNYITLMQIRHKNNIKFEVDIPDDLYEYKLQVMLLQPIVENSIRHGLGQKLSSQNPDALIKISASKQGSFMLIEVYDNGVGFDDTKGSLPHTQEKSNAPRNHIGLYNINERIKLMHGNEYGIEIESEKNKYSIVRLKLPIILE